MRSGETQITVTQREGRVPSDQNNDCSKRNNWGEADISILTVKAGYIAGKKKHPNGIKQRWKKN